MKSSDYQGKNFEIKSYFPKFDIKSKKINQIIERIEKKNASNNGFKDFGIENMSEFRLKNGQIFQKEINNYAIKTLFSLVKHDDVEGLDDFLSIPTVNINVTWFSENLLMHAIRYKNEKIAEYLILKGIDLNYEANFMEFNEKTNSVSYFSYSSRQMAYDNELYDIVDLIDIYTDRSTQNTRNFLINRYLNSMNKKHSEKKIYETILKKRINLEMENNLNKLEINDNSSNLSNENNLSQEIDFCKPKSEMTDDLDLNEMEENSNQMQSCSDYKNLEVNKIVRKNLYEVRRTKDIFKSFKNDKTDYLKVLEDKKHSNLKILGKKSHLTSHFSPKTKNNISNRTNETFDPKTIFYTKKSESVVPLNQFERKRLTKSLVNINNYYYLKNLENLNSSKSFTENYCRIKSANINYPEENTFLFSKNLKKQ